MAEDVEEIVVASEGDGEDEVGVVASCGNMGSRLYVVEKFMGVRECFKAMGIEFGCCCDWAWECENFCACLRSSAA